MTKDSRSWIHSKVQGSSLPVSVPRKVYRWGTTVGELGYHGGKVKVPRQAGSWDRKRRVVAKVEWHRPEACTAAGADLNHMAVVVERNDTGDVCLDYENRGHECHETALDAGAGSQWSALPTPIDLRIAVESPNSYPDGQNRWSSGECRSI